MFRLLLAVLFVSLATCQNNMRCRKKGIFISEVMKSMTPPSDDVELYNSGSKYVSLKGHYLVFFQRPTLNNKDGVPVTSPNNVYSLGKFKIPAKGYATLYSMIKQPFYLDSWGFAVALYKKLPQSKDAFTNKDKLFRADVKACLVDLLYYGNDEINYLEDIIMFNKFAKGLQRGGVVPLPFDTSVSRYDFNLKNPYPFQTSKTPTMGAENKDHWVEVRAWATGGMGVMCDHNDWEDIGRNHHKETNIWRSLYGFLVPASCKNLYISVRFNPAKISLEDRAFTTYLSDGGRTNSDTECAPIDSRNADFDPNTASWTRSVVNDKYDFDSMSSVFSQKYDRTESPVLVRFDGESQAFVCRIKLKTIED